MTASEIVAVNKAKLLAGTAGLDVGETVAASIEAWFRNPENRKLLGRLRAAGLTFDAAADSARAGAAKADTFLTGKTCVITGALPGRTREGAAEWLIGLGARVTDSVTSKTDFLIAGEAPGAGKVEKAKKLGVPILSPEELAARLGGTAAGDGRQENGTTEKLAQESGTGTPRPSQTNNGKPEEPAAESKPKPGLRQPELF
jgi:DNA ligase (NAD+)